MTTSPHITWNTGIEFKCTQECVDTGYHSGKKNLLKKSKQNVFGDTHLSRADDNDRNESKFDLQFLEI